ncbi:MAG TPA: hemolysin III family protein [Gemmataceae bacterium]|nr:hemolysin III family protein [Gemmataceae bacterium]
MELRDPVSSLSHLFTALWAVFATMVLLRLTAGGWKRKTAVAVYGTSMVLLYLASATFHGLFYETTEQRRFFQKLDQTAIYLLIAGTNTPIVAFVLRPTFRNRMLGIIWGLAFVGVAFQWLVPQAPHAVIVGVCMGLGIFGLVPMAAYYRALGWRAMNWVWLGSGAYILGGICELCEWPVVVPGWFSFHEFFHFCVTAGSVCFFLFISRHVIGYQRSEVGDQRSESRDPLAV